MPGDDQDIAEAFDSDKLDDDRDEPVGQLTYPPDRLLGANDPTADDWVTDSVASRADRLEPDPLDEISGVDGEALGQPEPTGDGATDGDVGDPVDAAAMAALEDMAADADVDVDEVDDLAGRLVEPGAGDDAVFPVDLEADAVATQASDSEDLTAEEAAIHVDHE